MFCVLLFPHRLLLPYECYLRGDQLRAVLPSQKRLSCDVLLDEGPVQRPVKRRLLPSIHHHQVRYAHSARIMRHVFHGRHFSSLQ